jgi:signal transduction histidine kinase
MHMKFFALSGLINAIAALGFGLIIFSKDRRSRNSQLFFVLTLCVALWSAAYWRWLSSTSEAPALLWVRILTVASFFIPVLYYHWVLDVLDVVKKTPVVILKLAYLVAFILALLTPTSLVIQGVEPRLLFPFWPHPGAFYGVGIAVLFFGLVTYTLWFLAREYRHGPVEGRGKIFFIILGSLLGFGGGATNFLLWYNIPILPYGNILVALFPILLGYAVLRHNLFNTKILAAEFLTFIIWVAVFIRVMLASSFSDRLQEMGLLALVMILGAFLIRSVLKLDAAHDKLKELNRQKTAFLSFASHQVKAPITTIRGYASMIAEGSYGPVTDKAKEAAGKIMDVGLQVATMVNDFLDLRKIEEGKMEFKMSSLDLVALIESVVDNLQLLARAKNLKLTLERSPAIPGSLTMVGDTVKLRQVFQNLIENAIKYTDQGFVRVSLQSRRGSGVSISVQDSGRGIPPEVLPRLFEQFYRGSAGSIQGSGLGLFIAREIIKAHGGDIVAESEGEGKGSVFRVEVPGGRWQPNARSLVRK